MESTKPRYRIISGFEDVDKFETSVNALAESGYAVSLLNVDAGKLSAILKLDTGNYENVTNLKDVDPLEVDKHISEGWEIASCSISTKFVRMVKRKIEA